jgi:hypothetical protein
VEGKTDKSAFLLVRLSSETQNTKKKPQKKDQKTKNPKKKT